ncbi:MAG: GlsB/YeaQ/YmgE family stress response membrane protein [Acidocella sp.]|nr:GlsB/YeaQ/YmgE family stress response membrane protein [Acidocella sp.]
MELSNQSLLTILLVGILAGWLAGKFVAGGGFGLIGDLIVGVIGAFIGDWLLPRLNIHFGTGILALILNATIGAALLLVILRVVSGRGGWRSRWSRW